ncbi:HD domain-containing protein [Nocardia amamiensis]|uniref:HD domain-containing protein n=1 Tax=Nocardia amamiensis TaxID=404578 RepID=UPI0008328D28|nr:HD domain-containing protein [Nocardia amamiensis]
MSDNEFQGIAVFGYETGRLKKLARDGWENALVPNPESVAEHSHRTAVLAYIIALLEGSPNPDRAATLGAFHDLPETRLGDKNAVSRRYVTTADARDVIRDQTKCLPDTIAARIRELVDEHESCKGADATLEARCSHDADKLECLLQACEYEAAGNRNMQVFKDTMLDALLTPTGKALGQAALETDPATWWLEFSANIGRIGRH